MPSVEEWVDRHGSVVGYPDAEALPTGEEILYLPVDVLVPPAVEGVIRADNAAQVQADIVVEGRTAPTNAADEILRERDVLVVPDILANAGGVVVSYFEWVQANQAFWCSERDVEERLAVRMTMAWERTTAFAAEGGLPLRTAATPLAVKSVADAHRQRGLYP